MNAMKTDGVLSFSIDSSEAVQSLGGSAEGIESVVTELLARFNQYGVAATWAFANPAGSTLARRIAAGPRPHDLAVLLANQTPTDADQEDSARIVLRRLHAAAAAGISVTTVAASGTWQVREMDLLAKQGISIIRGTQPLRDLGKKSLTSVRQGVQSLRYGLWHIPATIAIRGGRWIANLTQFSRVRRAIDRTALEGGLCHVQIDAASLTSGDVSMSLRQIDRVFRQLDRLREAGRIVVETLPEVAQRLQPRRTSTAAHSILRAA